MRFAAILVTCLVLLGAANAEEKRKVHKTKSGIEFEVIKPGDGVRPKPGDSVSVHYTGRLMNGRVFDSSLHKGKPFTFKLGTGYVIKGWDEGVALMPLGAKYRFRIPWKLAYGERGSPPDIPPRSDLEFDIELLAVTEGMPLPKFRKGNKERQITTESGLVYEVLVEGKGDTPRDDQGVKIAFGLWTKGGEYIQSTAASERYIGGPIDELRIGPLPMKFLPEAARLMKTGTVLRLEVPSKLCWGDRRMHPALKPGDVTVWQLLLDRINDIPKYREPNPEKAVTTADGIVYEILTKGDGRRTDPKVSVEVRYTAWVAGGKRFDSSHARGETVNFPLKRAHPPGMAKAIGLMREGDVYLVKVPKKLGYGEKVPRGSGIPKDAALVFLVELVKIIR